MLRSNRFRLGLLAESTPFPHRQRLSTFLDHQRSLTRGPHAKASSSQAPLTSALFFAHFHLFPFCRAQAFSGSNVSDSHRGSPFDGPVQLGRRPGHGRYDVSRGAGGLPPVLLLHRGRAVRVPNATARGTRPGLRRGRLCEPAARPERVGGRSPGQVHGGGEPGDTSKWGNLLFVDAICGFESGKSVAACIGPTYIFSFSLFLFAERSFHSSVSEGSEVLLRAGLCQQLFQIGTLVCLL